MSRTADPPADAADPFLWLEDIEGQRALAWVQQQNERSLQQLTADPRYHHDEQQARAILEDRSRIPYGSLRGGFVYNFWQDDEHVRGLWRRTVLASYETDSPNWEILLDVDALARAEGRNWVYKGVTCQPDDAPRCLISLSDGGQDANVVREFDVPTRSFVADGFKLPEAKSDLAWKDADTLLVATRFDAHSLTESGYPYVVKEWHRGQPLEQARELYRGEAQDVAVSPGRLDGAQGQSLLVIVRARTFFSSDYLTVGPGPLRPMTLPPKVDLQGISHGELLFLIRQDWQIAGVSFRTGSLLSMPLASVSDAQPAIRTVLVPGPRDSIEQVSVTGSGVLAALYSNVKGRLLRMQFDGHAWTATDIALPANGSVGIATANQRSDTAFVTYEDFLTPATLYRVSVATLQALPIKSLAQKFDAAKFMVEQLEASSRDGTRVPYFVVRPKAFVANGAAPTLLYGYGGFNVSMLPGYLGTTGKLWLEHGGLYVLANIRGGGEFGPAWHEAGLKTRRQVVYDDFIAVAQDLIARRISSPRRLGIEGGSNGGLLMGVMLTQRPELFHAAVVQVPLLDMLRFDKLLAGASWVDEYGSPQVPPERAWLEQMSPYQNLHFRQDFPEVFLLTSTKDDRVHPGHARKYAARLEALHMPFLYYENIDGGHSAAADLRERARRLALEFVYLSQRLMD
ncbi:MAG TPA: prolyl oligopeptidase family serine peptidase [Steroidobacteraceae bacterium]|jgi:prolyl oligopeptidase|nr:prolyl oligopeptidase family serine peptidase [Steroidobacteraceae bacterium]